MSGEVERAFVQDYARIRARLFNAPAARRPQINREEASEAPVRWKPVPGAPGYLVSTEGEIRHVRSGKARKPYRHKNGAYCVVLYVNRESKTFRVHTVVAEAFIGPRPEGKGVRHRDNDQANCRLANLYYGIKRKGGGRPAGGTQ